MTEEEFRAVLESSGLKLSNDTQFEIYQKIPFLRELISRVTRPKTRDSEPAIIFVPEKGR